MIWEWIGYLFDKVKLSNVKVILKFLFIATSGICLGIIEDSHGSHRAAPEPVCHPTMTQANTRPRAFLFFIRLVHANTLRIVPQYDGSGGWSCMHMRHKEC